MPISLNIWCELTYQNYLLSYVIRMCWHLACVKNSIGRTIKIDTHSLVGEKKRFVAICVLIQANHHTSSKVWIGETMQDLVYVEGPFLCSLEKWGIILKMVGVV